MKRKCKRIDISNIDFIKDAIQKCFANKTNRIYERRDVVEYFIKKHHGDIDSVAYELQSEILNRQLNVPPVRISYKLDKANNKERKITIEDIKMQFYDYIAYYALTELDSVVGRYQVILKEGEGTIACARYVHGWLQDNSIRYCLKMDIKKCYQSISRANMMKWLRRHVANPTLLWLIDSLLALIDDGLAIGSFLSIKLCALYISDIYHHIEGSYFQFRRGVKSNLVKHQLIYADDIFIFGSNAKQLHKVASSLIDYASTLGLKIKSDWRLIDLNPKNADAHVDVVGYKVYRNRITMRHKNYINLKKARRKYRKHPQSVALARSFIATYGMNAKHTNSIRFCRKYRIYPLYRKARKTISDYDKSKIRQ